MSKSVLRKIGIFFMSFTLIFTFVPILKTPTSFAASYDDGFPAGGFAYGISAFRDGYVYAAIWSENKIKRISLKDQTISDVVTARQNIKSVAMDHGGNLFFNYAEDNKIYKISASALTSLPVNAASAQVYYTLTAATGTDYIESFAFDPDDSLYLTVHNFSTSWQLSIRKLAAGGTAITKTIAMDFYVNGVAFSPSGDLYVLDQWKKIYKASQSALNQNGNIVFDPVATVNGDTPYDLSVLPDGRIVYSDWRQSAISYSGLTVEPHAPGLTAKPNNQDVLLTWDALPGITNYNVYQSEDAASIGNRITSVTAATYSVPGLTQGKTYYFTVKAVNAIGESPASNPVSASLTVPVPTSADPSQNRFVASETDIFEGHSLTLTAKGDRQAANGTVIGDERYLPATWTSTEPGQSGTFVLRGDEYTATYTPGTAGSFTMTVTFHKQSWNGTAWIDVEGETVTKTRNLTVVDASKAFPTHRDAREIDEHDGYIYTAHRGSGEITRTSVTDLTVDTVVLGMDDVMAVALSDKGDLYFTRDSDFNIYKIPASKLASLPVHFEDAEIAYTDPDSNYHYSLEMDAAGAIYFSSIVHGKASLHKWVNGTATTVFENYNHGISGLAFAPTGDLYILDEWGDIYQATPSQLAEGAQSSLTFITHLDADAAGLGVLQDGNILYTDYDRDQFIWYAGSVIPLLKKANPDRNKIGVVSTYVTLGGTLTLNPEGDWQSAEGRMIGDERYIPVEWESTEPGQSGSFVSGEHGYTSSYTPGKAGSYTLAVTFQKQTWNGTKWIDVSETTDRKTVDIYVSSVIWSELDNGLDVVGGLNGPGSSTVDGDGNVYVTDTGNNRVLEWVVSGEHAGTWREWPIDERSDLGTLNHPQGIASDGKGNIYVIDSGNKRILKLVVTGEDAGTWSEFSVDLGSDLGELVRLFAITVDKQGHLYITDHDRILKFDSETQIWSKIDTSGGPIGVNGLAVDESGNLYAADTAGSRIMKLTVTGEGAGTWSELGNGPGSGLGQFRYPNGVAVDRNGNVYVADSVNDRIQIWMAATGAWSEWTAPGEGLGRFDKPTSIVTDLQGNVYVVDNVNNRVLLMSPLVQYPGAPTDVTATAGNGEATIRFTAPANNGGSPITGYIVTANPGGITASGTDSPIVITGLTNGTSYTFTVKAVNAAGSGISSASSNEIIPTTPSNPGGNPTSGSGTQTDSVEVLINGVAEKAGTATTTQRAGQSVTSIKLDWNKLTDKLTAGGAGTVITIATHNGSEVVVGELNGQMVKDMENKQALLVLKTDQAIYTLPAQQVNIDAISKQLGKSVTLADIRIEVEIAISATDTVKRVEDAATKGKFTLVAPPMDFTIRAIYGDTTLEVAKFNAPVERMIAIPDGVDASRITTGVVVDTDGTVRHVPTQIVVNDGKTYARINSLTNSTYAVVWHPLAFLDMANHWAKAAVNDMGSRMVISGVGHELFNPDADITRAEFAAILVRGLGLAPERGAAGFADVPASAWYNDSVSTAYAYGLIKGFNDGAFRPSAKVTREEAMVMIARAMEITRLQANTNSDTPEKQLSTFADFGQVSEWAVKSIADCLQAGVVSGKGNGLLAPKAHATRAEVAVMIQQLLQKSKLI